MKPDAWTARCALHDHSGWRAADTWRPEKDMTQETAEKNEAQVSWETIDLSSYTTFLLDKA